MNNFGFNSGAKIGEFGIFESNSAPVPPLPQPQYVVLEIDMTNSAGALPFTEKINTLTNGATITDFQNSVDENGDLATIVTFSGGIYTSLANVFLQGRFGKWVEQDNTYGTPTYQVRTIDNTKFCINAICWDRSFVYAIGTFYLTIIIFE